MKARWLNVVFLVLPSSCLGENPPGEDLASQLARYEDRGRTSIDPLTPGALTLTFDDGPGPFTKNIIDVLERHRVPATFFVVGRLIAGNRDVLRYARDHGQQVSSHSYNHEPQPSLTEAQFKDRVRAVKNNIDDTDNGRLYFRFPFGAANEEQLRWLREVDFDGKSYRPVGWHSDSQDFEFNVGYPNAPFSTTILTDERLTEGGACNGQPNPFQRDFVGWTLFIARKSTGGVMLFHDTKLITHDKLDEILVGLEAPEQHWASLPPETVAAYTTFYDCEQADRFLRFTFRPLHDGLYPSLLE
jgi:peptidoglycan-N-acetylglucosamine deacetylase